MLLSYSPWRIGPLGLSYTAIGSRSRPGALCNHKWRFDMSWKTPKIVEIALGAEINSYACAEARK